MTQVQHFLCFTSCASRKGARKNKAACRKKDRLVGNKYVDVLFWPLSSFSCTHQTSITHTPHVINCDVAHGLVLDSWLVLDELFLSAVSWYLWQRWLVLACVGFGQHLLAT